MPRAHNATQSKTKQARNTPVIKSQAVEAAEQDLGGEVSRIIVPGAEGQGAIEAVEGPSAMELADQLKFMEEEVTVIVHETTNSDDERIVETWVNGKKQIFQRGVATKCKRYFVERLARAKPISYRQRVIVDHEGGRDYENIGTRALKYPFVVVGDSAKGADWLAKVLREP